MIRFFFSLSLLLGATNRQTTLITPPFSHDFGFHRASKFYIDMYLGRSFRFDDPEGLCAEKLRAEDDTTTSQDDHILTLLGVNCGTSQIIFNTGIRRLGSFGRVGSGAGEFARPHGITVNRAGVIYVADTDNNRIVRLQYTRDGLEWVRALAGFGHPYGVALDARDNVFVTDGDAGQVVVIDSLGRVIDRWGELRQPTGICVVDRLASRNYFLEDFVVVIDNRGTRVSKFSRTGELLASLSARDIGLFTAEFSYCAWDYYANIYVTDRHNDQIHKFDRDLNYIASFGRTGKGDGEFHSPRGIAIGRQYGQVFIGEAEGGQYYWIGLDAYFVGCFPEVMERDQPGTTIALYVTELCELTLTVLDRKGKLVRDLYASRKPEKPGEILVVWDGRDNANVPVPPGKYTILAKFKPTYGGARVSFKKELTAKVKRI